MNNELLKRIERLEALDEIRQLAAKYSLSLDMRDLDAHVNLFAPDIQVTRDLKGREYLKSWLDDTLRHQFTGTSHHIGNHVIEFSDPDNAHGVVYSKNEHETPTMVQNQETAEWVIMQMIYWDNYQKIDGRWLFRRRLPCYWYATDLNSPPVGNHKMRWPDREPYDGTYHELFPSYKNFWQNPPADGTPEVAAPAAIGDFLNTMRGDAPMPKIRVR